MLDVRTGSILKTIEVELPASNLQLTPEAIATPSATSPKSKSMKSLDELRDAVLAAEAAAREMMGREQFTDEQIEYVAKYVNRGTDSVDGSMPELLEHDEIKAWKTAERAYVKKRDASGPR